MIMACDKGIYINKVLYKYYRDIPVIVLDQLNQRDRKQVEYWFILASQKEMSKNVSSLSFDRN